MLKIALTGNPNAGKTTLFNTFTGSRQHVGNWPGKTVEKKEAKIKDYHIIDLPGTYSLTSYSDEEKITRDYLAKEKPDVVIDVIDATNLQRNLYLALELLELDTNLIIAINMDKFASKKGIDIDEKKISELLGVQVVKVDAKDKKEVNSLLEKALKYKKKISSISYGEEIEEHLKVLEDEVNKQKINNYCSRWISLKLLEQDEEVLNKLSRPIKKKLDKITVHLKHIYGEDFYTIISDYRHGIASGIIKESVIRSKPDKFSKTDLIDKFATNKLLGLPIFLLIIYMMFFLTFNLASPFINIIESFVSFLAQLSTNFLATSPSWVQSLITDAIIGGVGSVIVFLPNIFILFFIISLLEDSGYLARAAFIMDRLMHKIGLHGKSFIPLILGFGCNVPAIMATRSLDNKKDRILTILINPFMSCSARLPVYILFVSAFFPNNQSTIIFSLYLLGILLAILSGLLFKKIFFKGITSELVMELPPYRLPTLSGALIHMWERGKMFLYKAGTLIFAFVIVIWFLSSLPLGVDYASEQSFIGTIGKTIAPFLEPIGFGTWQTTVALLFGIAAKEVVISTFGTLYGVSEAALGDVLSNIFTPLSAYAFMVMTLVYIPCIATIAVIKRETGSWKWASFSIVYSLLLGWLLAFIIYQGGLLLGL